MIQTSGGGEWHAVQNLRTFFSMETRLTNLYVPLHALLPQMLHQTFAKIFLWACKTNWEGVPRDPIFRGDETQFNFWGLFLAWKRGGRIIMYLYMSLSRKCDVKLWHKCSHRHAKQIEKGCNVIRYSGKGGWQYNF